MTIQEIIQEGLEKSKDEAEFRVWASQWMEEAKTFYDLHDNETCMYSLADLAFRAREMASTGWISAIREVYWMVNVGSPRGPFQWGIEFSAPYHWIIAGIVSKELRKENSDDHASPKKQVPAM